MITTSISFMTLSPRVVVCPDTIVQVCGEGNYSRIILHDGQNIIICQTLRILQQKLPPEFIRVHKSHLINIRHLSHILRHKKIFVLTNGLRVPIARRRVLQIRNGLLNTAN